MERYTRYEDGIIIANYNFSKEYALKAHEELKSEGYNRSVGAIYKRVRRLINNGRIPDLYNIK